MNVWLKIYLFGCLSSLFVVVWTLQDENSEINWMDFWFGLILSICSWSTLLGLGVGYLLKRRSDNK